MLKIVRYGPNIPEQPQIAEHIRQVLNDIFYNTNEPKEVLANAATKSAKALGW
jgi:multiple sugar transport system substrate-binding protein